MAREVETNLLSCPFCGGDAQSHKADIRPSYQTSSVNCTRCPAEIGKTGLDAEVFWNRRQQTGWRDEPAEEVSVTAIAVKASGGEKAWSKLSAAQRQDRLENARDVIAATGFMTRHDYWQSISTAPKDGTKVLLFVEQEFSGTYPNRSFFITDAYCDDEGDWMTTWGHDTVESVAYNVPDFKVNPTYWMHLPPKPE